MARFDKMLNLPIYSPQMFSRILDFQERHFEMDGPKMRANYSSAMNTSRDMLRKQNLTKTDFQSDTLEQSLPTNVQ